MVAFADDKDTVLVGTAARRKKLCNPKQTVYGGWWDAIYYSVNAKLLCR